MTRAPATRDDFVWLLNPDAELEIARPGDYTTEARLALEMGARRGLFAPLVRNEPAYFVHELPRATKSGPVLALPWSNTPSTRRVAERLGYRVPEAPPRDVLERTLSRRFLVESSFGARADRTFVSTTAELERALARLGPGVRLRTKRGYGFAGRGHRVLDERLVKDDDKFLAQGVARGGLLIEDEKVVLGEFSIHGVVRGDRLVLGEPCRLEVDAFSAPVSVARADDLEESTRRTLVELGTRAAAELLSAGYFGPFGLDVLEVVAPAGPVLVPSDLNSRFTLGWSTGLGSRRDEALDLVFRTEPAPQE